MGVWCLGFMIWCLGFGVWGLGLGVRVDLIGEMLLRWTDAQGHKGQDDGRYG